MVGIGFRGKQRRYQAMTTGNGTIKYCSQSTVSSWAYD